MRACSVVACVLGLSAGGLVAQAGYETAFESFLALPTGAPVAGQNGFYVPVTVPPSIDGKALQYAGNAYGVPPYFAAFTRCLAVVSAASAQASCERSIAIPSDVPMHVEFDVCCIYTGTTAPSGEFASFSLEPTTSRHARLVARWPVGATFPPTTWNADVEIGPASPGSVVTPPHPAFVNLPLGVWHRWGCTLDLVTNQYYEFSMSNHATNARTIYHVPSGLMPVVNTTGAMPTAMRFSSPAAANVVFAVDNVSITVHADWRPYGVGCAGALGVPQLAATGVGRPVLSLAMPLQVSNLPNIGILATGFSASAGGGFVLPLDLTAFGMPACYLHADPAATVFLVGNGGVATWNLLVPDAPYLLGTFFYNQAFALDAAANATGITASNGGRGCVGR